MYITVTCKIMQSLETFLVGFLNFYFLIKIYTSTSPSCYKYPFFTVRRMLSIINYFLLFHSIQETCRFECTCRLFRVALLSTTISMKVYHSKCLEFFNKKDKRDGFNFPCWLKYKKTIIWLRFENTFEKKNKLCFLIFKTFTCLIHK